ncbi:MAG: allophanate hydrolase [Phycisphaerae bacterium]|nr:MAG: allophanate hydrolase [Phycisphaerae bacterium]
MEYGPAIAWSSDRTLRIVAAGDGEAWRLARAVARAGLAGVIDTVPTRRVVQVMVDPSAPGRDTLEGRMREALCVGTGADAEPGRLVEIPVCYGGEYGPDLRDVAAACGRDEAGVVACHAGAEYTAEFFGFMPGFAYLRGVPEELRVPRLDSPRTIVPVGSVAIAGEYAGVYPASTPGGWRILGRTPWRMFDVTRPEPVRLRVGGRVRFVPITPARFAEMAAGAP